MAQLPQSLKPDANRAQLSPHYDALAFFLAAQRAFISADSLLRPAALMWRRGRTAFFLRSAHIALAASEMRLRPAALIRRGLAGTDLEVFPLIDSMAAIA